MVSALNRLIMRRPLVWLIAIASMLRLVHLGAESLWYDETFTAWVVKLPLDRFWIAVRGDVHPPLYYLIQWVNIRLLGDSEFALRLPSALLGILSVILIWQIARDLDFDIPSMAFVAGLLAAIMPGVLYYSQEARMYTLLLCFVLGGVWAAFHQKWWLFGLCCAGAAYSQNLGLFYAAALGVAALLLRLRRVRLPELTRQLKQPVIALAAAGVLWAPWGFGVELHQAANMGAGFWLQPLAIGDLFAPITSEVMGDRALPPILYGAFAASLGLTAIGLIVSRRWLKTDRGLIVLAVIVGGPALLAIASIVWRSVYLARAMIASATLLSLLWSYALFKMKPANRHVALAVMVPMLAITLGSYYFPSQGGRVDWRDRTAQIEAAWQPGDVVFFGSINAAIGLHYYLDKPYALRHEASDLNQSLTIETQDAMGFNEHEFSELQGLGYKRAWLVVDLNPLSSSEEIQSTDAILSSYPHTLWASYALSDFNKDGIYIVNLERTF